MGTGEAAVEVGEGVPRVAPGRCPGTLAGIEPGRPGAGLGGVALVGLVTGLAPVDVDANELADGRSEAAPSR